MKTYYFATEDKESMKKWMNAMSLATIMQKLVKNNFDSGIIVLYILNISYLFIIYQFSIFCLLNH